MFKEEKDPTTAFSLTHPAGLASLGGCWDVKWCWPLVTTESQLVSFVASGVCISIKKLWNLQFKLSYVGLKGKSKNGLKVLHCDFACESSHFHTPVEKLASAIYHSLPLIACSLLTASYSHPEALMTLSSVFPYIYTTQRNNQLYFKLIGVAKNESFRLTTSHKSLPLPRRGREAVSEKSSAQVQQIKVVIKKRKYSS